MFLFWIIAYVIVDFILQANLCYVDIDSQTIQLPEELPSFPQRTEFVSELVDLLTKHKVYVGPIDRYIEKNIPFPQKHVLQHNHL